MSETANNGLGGEPTAHAHQGLDKADQTAEFDDSIKIQDMKPTIVDQSPPIFT